MKKKTRATFPKYILNKKNYFNIFALILILIRK